MRNTSVRRPTIAVVDAAARWLNEPDGEEYAYALLGAVADGWYFVAQRGSHRQYKHPTKPGRVTIPGKPSRELYPELERSILRQAGLLMGGDR